MANIKWLSLQLSLRKLTVDKTRNLKRIDAEMTAHFHAACASFLRAVIPHVPVWTGMARGSLIPLAQYLSSKGQSVTVDISPDPESEPEQRRGQTEQAGQALGTFEVTRKEGIQVLRFSPKVFHYQWNDEHPGPQHLRNPTPWYSFQAGREAAREYREYVRAHLPRIKITVQKTIRRS